MFHFPSPLVVSLALAVTCPCLLAAPVRFIPMNDEIAASAIAVEDSKSTVTLKDLNSQKRSKAYNFKVGKTPLKLVAMDQKTPDGKAATVEISLPSEFKSPLVLILADPQHPSGLRTIAIEETNAGFEWGSLRFLNVTDDALTLRYGEEIKQLPAGNKPVDVLPPADAHNVGVQFYKESAPAVILYSAVWEHDPTCRKLIVIMPGVDPRIRALDIKVLPETKPTGK